MRNLPFVANCTIRSSTAILDLPNILRVTIRLWTLEMRLQPLPAVFVIIRLHLLALPERKIRASDHQAALEHERHAALADLHGLELCVAGLLVRRGVGTVGGHDIVQTRARGLKATFARLFRIIGAANQAHEFGHCVSVVPWWPECLLSIVRMGSSICASEGERGRISYIFSYEPSRRENNKVRNRGA